jgi:hypothetical protein
MEIENKKYQSASMKVHKLLDFKARFVPFVCFLIELIYLGELMTFATVFVVLEPLECVKLDEFFFLSMRKYKK